MSLLDRFRPRKNPHEWEACEPIDTPHGILRRREGARWRGWRTDYRCSRCGVYPRCPSDIFDILVEPPIEYGCTALPLPCAPPLAAVSALPVPATGSEASASLPVACEERR